MTFTDGVVLAGVDMCCDGGRESYLKAAALSRYLPYLTSGTEDIVRSIGDFTREWDFLCLLLKVSRAGRSTVSGVHPNAAFTRSGHRNRL